MDKPEGNLASTPNAKTKKSKTKSFYTNTVFVLASFVVLVGVSISIAYNLSTIENIVGIIKNPKDNILVCKKSGGEWWRNGWGEWWCRYRTNDWGKTCYSKSDCSGSCLTPRGGIYPSTPETKNGNCSKYIDGGSDTSVSITCTFEKGRTDFSCVIY